MKQRRKKKEIQKKEEKKLKREGYRYKEEEILERLERKELRKMRMREKNQNARGKGGENKREGETYRLIDKEKYLEETN